MPKLKTRKAASKRFRAISTGKIVRRKAFKNHLLEHKSPNKKRNMSKMAVVDETDAGNVRLMLLICKYFRNLSYDTGKTR